MSRIKELRKSMGLSQIQLADRLHVHQTAISQWEKGKTIPDVENIRAMAAMFNVSTDYLLGYDNVTKEEKPATIGDGRAEFAVSLLEGLSPSDVQRVTDFVAGLKAAKSAGPNPPDPDRQ